MNEPLALPIGVHEIRATLAARVLPARGVGDSSSVRRDVGLIVGRGVLCEPDDRAGRLSRSRIEVDPEEFYKNPTPFLLDSYRQYLEGIVPASTL